MFVAGLVALLLSTTSMRFRSGCLLGAPWGRWWLAMLRALSRFVYGGMGQSPRVRIWLQDRRVGRSFGGLAGWKKRKGWIRGWVNGSVVHRVDQRVFEQADD